MRPALRLSINNALGRPSRTILLTLAVALATALVTAISCALASMNAGLTHRVDSTIGKADIQIREIGEQSFDAAIYERVRRWPGVMVASPMAKGPVTLESPNGTTEIAIVEGIVPELEHALVEVPPSVGRRIEADDEIILDEELAQTLSVTVGQELTVVRFGPEMPPLRVVGIRAKRAMEPVARIGAVMTIPALEQATMIEGRLADIKIKLAAGIDAGERALDWQRDMPPGILVRATERVTSGIGQTIQANHFLSLMATVLAYIASGFIIMTGLSSSAAERQRELAIMRCIGATRFHLAVAQIITGSMVGLGGALVGVPLGIFLSWLMTVLLPDRLPAGLHVPNYGIAWAFIGSVVSGVCGAAFPAFKAARVRPLLAMASEAAPPSKRSIAIITALGGLGLLTQYLIVGTIDDGTRMFWLYATIGLPVMLIGYFLLGVPTGIIIARLFAPILSFIFRLPPSALKNNYLNHPYRNGLTAGALMVGLAMMISIWANGSALLKDWLGAIQFPDAFVHGWLGIEPDAQRRIEELPFVTGTVAITMQKVDSAAFGIRGVGETKTTFLAFEPEPFFNMTKLDWVAGDPEYAIRRLKEGGALLVAKEFLVHRDAYEVGQTFTITHNGVDYPFEIVGAVSSPGLDLVSKYFDIGREYAERAMHAVFGSRDDLKRIFQTDAIHLVQVGLDGSTPDAQVIPAIRAKVNAPALVVGSGQEIKAQIIQIGTGTMRIATVIALGAMFIGCLGVGNLVIASIDARKHQFGILRAVGASGSLLMRLILAEILLIAITAAILGTALGLQGAWAGLRLYELLAGLNLRLAVPPSALALGWAILISMTLLTALPIVLSVAAKRPLTLLRSTR